MQAQAGVKLYPLEHPVCIVDFVSMALPLV